MIRDANPILQAFLGGLFTYGITAVGAALVIFLKGTQVSTVTLGNFFNLPGLAFKAKILNFGSDFNVKNFQKLII
jgi:hypothetical protein